MKYAAQVVQETGQAEGTELAFTGMLFQPVPWSMQTKKGMPADFEKYAADPDYVFINTPPNFMFQVSSAQHSIALRASIEDGESQLQDQAQCDWSVYSRGAPSQASCTQRLMRCIICAGQDLQAFTALCYLQEEVTALAQALYVARGRAE